MTCSVHWRCDRCGLEIVAEASTYDLVRSPSGWRTRDDIDVCATCVTDGEHVDDLLLDIEADAIFGRPS